MIAFRSEREFEIRFGRVGACPDGRFSVSSYLRTTERSWPGGSTPASYRALLDAMDAHDVGRGRGGVACALQPLGGAHCTPSEFPAINSTRLKS